MVKLNIVIHNIEYYTYATHAHCTSSAMCSPTGLSPVHIAPSCDVLLAGSLPVHIALQSAMCSPRQT